MDPETLPETDPETLPETDPETLPVMDTDADTETDAPLTMVAEMRTNTIKWKT